MAKFHINEKGEPGKCSAEAGGCPFGTLDEHFPTAKDARLSYEITMEKKLKKDWEALKAAEARAEEARNELYRWNSRASIAELNEQNRNIFVITKAARAQGKELVKAKKDAFANFRKAEVEDQAAHRELKSLKKRSSIRRINRGIKLTPYRKLPKDLRSTPEEQAELDRKAQSSHSEDYKRYDHRYTHTGHYDSRSSHQSF